MNEVNAFLTPGMLVRNTAKPEWGTGQVQSNIADRITVNFGAVGKVVLDGKHVELEIVFA